MLKWTRAGVDSSESTEEILCAGSTSRESWRKDKHTNSVENILEKKRQGTGQSRKGDTKKERR